MALIRKRRAVGMSAAENRTPREKLAWPVGTVSGRLSRGRQLLKDRLERRGGPCHPLPVFRRQNILVVESPDRRSIQAMSLAAGDQGHAVWSKFTLPPGVTATAICGYDTLAPIWKGKRIDQVAAFSGSTGLWAVQKLAKPVEEEISPALAPGGGAIYQVGNDVYAFSARTGTWGALHLEGTEKPLVSASPSDIEVLQGNKLYVFSIKHGQWSPGVEIYLKPSGPAPDRTR